MFWELTEDTIWKTAQVSCKCRLSIIVKLSDILMATFLNGVRGKYDVVLSCIYDHIGCH